MTTHLDITLTVNGEARTLERPGDVTDSDQVDLVVDRLEVKSKARLAEALQAAYQVGRGFAAVAEPDGPPQRFSERPGCAEHGVLLPVPALEPRMFSFNSHHGACERCNGLGEIQRADPKRVIRHQRPRSRSGDERRRESAK